MTVCRCSDSDSDVELPTVCELLARATPVKARARRGGPSTSRAAALTTAPTAKPVTLAVDHSPEAFRKHQSLVDELFPPSPPPTSASSAGSAGAETFSGASERGDPTTNTAPSSPGDAAFMKSIFSAKEAIARLSLSGSTNSVVADSAEEAGPGADESVDSTSIEDDLAAIANVFARRPTPAKPAPPPAASSRDHTSTYLEARTPSRPAPKMCITLSSDSESERYITSPPNSPPRPKSRPAPAAASAPASTMLATPRVQVEHVAHEGENVQAAIPGGWATEDDDFNAGVLVYVPTPRKVTPLKNTPAPTPARTSSTESKPSTSKSTLLDLTLSSDDDDEPVRLPFQPTTPSTPPARPKATRKKAPASTPARSDSESRLTAAQRESLPGELIAQLDEAVFRREWRGVKRLPTEKGDGPGLPAGLEVRWSNTLRNTAGRATWKSVKKNGQTTHHCHIELALKVTDTPSKLLHTLSHELCHIAAWVLSDEVKPSHGPAFKLWSARIMSVRPDIHITTTHKYEIVYKWRWRCGACSAIFGRHSNSIDETKVGCACGGRLVRIDQEGELLGPRTPAKKTGWQEFLASETPKVREAHPGLGQSNVMKLVAEKWSRLKLQAQRPQGERTPSTADVLVDRMNRLAV